MNRVLIVVAFLVAAAALLAGCGGKETAETSAAEAQGATVVCPQAWKAGWQRLANDVGAPVYCPSWMPRPLDGRIGGVYKNGRWVDEKDKSYLVSFLWVDHDAGVSREVHANFRGYPGRTAVPICESTETVKGKTLRKPIPCFSDARGTRTVGDITATVYTVNEGIDAWHVLYAWKKDGSLYTVSEHVTAPYSYKQVVRNLDRMARGLVWLEPAS